MQHVFDEQNANFDHFNNLKTLILSIIPMLLNVYQVKNRGVHQYKRVPQFE